MYFCLQGWPQTDDQITLLLQHVCVYWCSHVCPWFCYTSSWVGGERWDQNPAELNSRCILWWCMFLLKAETLRTGITLWSSKWVKSYWDLQCACTSAEIHIKIEGVKGSFYLNFLYIAKTVLNQWVKENLFNK